MSEAHNDYISAIRDRCLLNERARPLLNSLLSILRGSERFADYFAQWINNHDDEQYALQLNEIKEELDRIEGFLRSAIHTLRLRSAVVLPHLEALDALLVV